MAELLMGDQNRWFGEEGRELGGKKSLSGP